MKIERENFSYNESLLIISFKNRKICFTLFINFIHHRISLKWVFSESTLLILIKSSILMRSAAFLCHGISIFSFIHSFVKVSKSVWVICVNNVWGMKLIFKGSKFSVKLISKITLYIVIPSSLFRYYGWWLLRVAAIN